VGEDILGFMTGGLLGTSGAGPIDLAKGIFGEGFGGGGHGGGGGGKHRPGEFTGAALERQRLSGKGVVETDAAKGILESIGARTSGSALTAMQAWIKQEGGHFVNQAKFNPLNTTQPMPGAGNTGSQGNIKVYRSWQQGIEATAKTLSG